MNCPACGMKMTTANTRQLAEKVRRTRNCPGCFSVYYTFEYIHRRKLSVEGEKLMMMGDMG